MSTDATTRTPAQTLREAARLMREQAGEMRAEMDRMPATWEPGYREEVRASLGGPAGDHAAPWGPEASDAAADLLDEVAGDYEAYDGATQLGLAYRGPGKSDPAIAMALAYLGETP